MVVYKTCNIYINPKEANIKNLINIKVSEIEASPTTTLKNKALQLKAEGKNIINLSIGEPDFDTPEAIKEETIKSLRAGFTHYVGTGGIPSLREKIFQKLCEENHIVLQSPEQIIVTPGAKFALYLAFTTLLNEGDEVLIFDPCWVSYNAQIRLAGGIPVPVPLSFEQNFTITKQLLEQYVTPRTKMIVVNNPNNPTGRVLTEVEIQILADFIYSHGLLAVSDEIYERIIFDGGKNISLASISKIQGQVLTVSGFSKSYAMTGWRIGYIAAPSNITKMMLKVHSHLLSCTTSFLQPGAVAAFSCENSVTSMLQEYQRRRDWLIPRLKALPFFNVNNPEGTFYVYPKVSYKGMSGAEFCSFIFDKYGILATPGNAFGQHTADCVRLSFATSIEELEKALSNFREIL